MGAKIWSYVASHPIPPHHPLLLNSEAQEGGFWSYVAGTAYRLMVAHEIPQGVEIDNYRTTLPMGKGLSSSAAICVLAGHFS